LTSKRKPRGRAGAGKGKTLQRASSVTPIPEMIGGRATDTSSEDSFEDLAAVRGHRHEMLQASAADLHFALGEVAANQRHVERERLPGLGDRAVVAIYAQLVVVVWGVRRDGHDLYQVEGGRGQH
jgi:hypothetical protein